jgi:hypothetical protein
MNVLIMTFFNDRFATAKREEQLTLAALGERIQNTEASEKAVLPWLKCARFGELRSRLGCLRNNDNVIAITGIEADYDGEEISFEDAKQTLIRAGVLAILYTSPGHTEEAPRWRVLCPLLNEHPPERRDIYMARLIGLYGNVFSPESWVLSQCYYFGSIRRNPSHRVVVLDGNCIDQRGDLDQTAIGRAEKPKPDGIHGQHQRQASRPEDITDQRIHGLVTALLNNVRTASDGMKHHTLRGTARALGGYLHLIGWSVDDAVEHLVAALPQSVRDWDSARETAAYGVIKGMEAPLELEDRPNPHRFSARGPPNEE